MRIVVIGIVVVAFIGGVLVFRTGFSDEVDRQVRLIDAGEALSHDQFEESNHPVQEEQPIPENEHVAEVPNNEEQDVVEESQEVEQEAESHINLAVPFTAQAPFGEWDAIHKDACEEASIYMVAEYYRGTPDGPMSKQQADTELLKLVDVQNELWGFFEDTTAQETGVLAERVFGLSARLIENPTADDIKAELREGRPVILPLAGQDIGNPYFTPPGPVYHMLVVRGFTQDGMFITNDPGTRRGEAYQYPEAVLMEAIHDWNEDDIYQGRRVAIVLTP